MDVKNMGLLPRYDGDSMEGGSQAGNLDDRGVGTGNLGRYVPTTRNESRAFGFRSRRINNNNGA